MAIYAYVTCSLDDSLVIVDVTDPTTPVYLGHIRAAANWIVSPWNSFIVGDRLYIASTADHLTVIDISDPTAPAYLGHITGAGLPNYLNGACDVFVKGNYAYVVAYADDALTIFDISDPAAPTFVGVIRGAGAPNWLDSPKKLHVRGDYAYVVASNAPFGVPDDALSIFNISDPTAPTHVATIRGAGAPPWLGSPYGIFVRGDYAYVAASDDDALTIINVADPAAPTFVGVIRGAGAPNWLGSASGVHVVGNYAYVAVAGDDALTIINVANPAHPVFAGSIQGAGAPNYLGAAHSVFATPDYAYVTSNTDDALSIFDVSNPAAPVLVGVIRGAGAPPGGNWLNSAFSVIIRSIPVVTVDEPTDVTNFMATLNGRLEHDGYEPTVCGFEWGPTTAYGFTTPTESKVSGETFSQTLKGLDAGFLLHFRAFATNVFGTGYSADMSFNTEPIISQAHPLSRREL